MNLPIRTLGLAAAALLIGSSLAPVSAQQQQSGVDGQVALRSDGALYLISNGQRRWISTVAATDEEINALSEGDPIYAGLAPQGSGQASFGPTKPSTGTTASKTTGSSASKTNTKPTAKPTPKTSGERGEDVSEDIPIEVDIGGDPQFSPGDTRTIEIKTRRGVTCELVVELPDGDDITEDSKNADSRGRCEYTIEIDDGADEGKGKIIGTVREGGKVNRQEIDIEIED